MKTHIYALRDPRTGMTRYIGKTGRTLEERFKRHYYDGGRKHATPRGSWLKSLRNLGLRPRIDLIETVDGDGCDKEPIGNLSNQEPQIMGIPPGAH